jgi:hypothetical protein
MLFAVAALEDRAREGAADRPAVHVVGEQQSARGHELRDLLMRNGIAFEFLLADSERGRLLLERSGHPRSPLPVVITYTGEALADPKTDELAAAVGLATLPAAPVDVAIVGAGPAGLSAAVYTASEGLATLLIEREAIGGQAGSSSLIRNYLGFPRGTSGRGLANKAFAQVWSFGADTAVTWPVTGLHPVKTGYLLRLADGSEVHSRSVVIATGVSYPQARSAGSLGPPRHRRLLRRCRLGSAGHGGTANLHRRRRQLCRPGGGGSRPLRTTGDRRSTTRVGCRHDGSRKTDSLRGGSSRRHRDVPAPLKAEPVASRR